MIKASCELIKQSEALQRSERKKLMYSLHVADNRELWIIEDKAIVAMKQYIVTGSKV